MMTSALRDVADGVTAPVAMDFLLPSGRARITNGAITAWRGFSPPKPDDAGDSFDALLRWTSRPYRRSGASGRDPSAFVIALLTTTDAVKLSAAQAILQSAGIESVVFDRAAGTLWMSIIPMRLMVATDAAAKARAVLTEARWVAAGDGEWDLTET